MDETKTNFSKLLDRAHAGETIFSGRGGKPYAKLVPIDDAPQEKLLPRKPGGLEHLGLTFSDTAPFDPLPDEELTLW